MAYSRSLVLVAVLLIVTCGAPFAWAADAPSDLCSLLSPADVSKILGQNFSAPVKTEAPRPFANTNTGTDCNYAGKNGKLWFRAYVDPSPAAATDLFARLSKFYGTPTPVNGMGDEAYLDRDHALHARKGKVRFYLNLSPINPFTPAKQKQLTDLGSVVAGKL